MTHRIRKPLLALIVAAGSVLALPAMAQSTAGQAQTQQDAAAAAASSAAGAGQAAGQAGGGGQTWASLDTDGNGTINKAESQANAGLAQVFDQADANKDGELTPDEYKAFVEAQRGAAGAAEGN
ncbi:EF-hand domain-containing protein [Xanthomonas sp. 60]